MGGKTEDLKYKKKGDLKYEGKVVNGYPIPARITRIVGMILKQKPDIITLQEVDHYAYFTEILKDFGYEGCFEKKVASASSGGNGQEITDGCMVFWNTMTMKSGCEEERFCLPQVLAGVAKKGEGKEKDTSAI